jgi:hypothetical protein
MILSSAALILRGIVTLLLLLSYNNIEEVCEYVFGAEDGIPGSMALQYIIVMAIFVVMEILLSLISLVQGSQSKEEYVSMLLDISLGYMKYHDKLLKKQVACYEIALKAFF